MTGIYDNMGDPRLGIAHSREIYNRECDRDRIPLCANLTSALRSESLTGSRQSEIILYRGFKSAIEKEGVPMIWEKLFLSAIITFILSVFASSSKDFAPQRHSNQSEQGFHAPLVMKIK